MTNCIFCKIVSGDIPATKIYEDDTFIAFLDINPCTKGHAVIIPKKHVETIYELPAGISQAYMPVIQRIGNAMLKSLDCRKVALTVWGEDVDHAHIHLIPRYEKDGLKVFPQKKAEAADLVLTAEKIIKEM